MTPTISIIIPVYNVEKYLRECLDSVVAQTFTDWECILVDDGSKDSSPAICDEYAQRDHRFTVIHKENGGVSSARNCGIKRAIGKWIYFCDSDDAPIDNALEYLIAQLSKSDRVEFVMAQANEYRNGSLKPTKAISENRQINSLDCLKLIFFDANEYYNGFVWTKLFNADIIRKNNIRFKEDIYYNEDRLFIVEYLTHVSGVCIYTTQPIYNYYLRDSSAMSNLSTKYETDLDASNRMYTLAKTYHSPELLNLIRAEIRRSYNINIGILQNSNHYTLLNRTRLYLKMRKHMPSIFKRYLAAIKRRLSFISHFSF